MDWCERLDPNDLARFLLTQGDDFTRHAVLWDPAMVNLYVTEHEDFLLGFLKRWQYELKGNYDELIPD